ncbi:hypothetical protein MKW92_040889 [Papaver armeniacum]|nr:hypothetical protein MKW92_040889 [Papaver armeniacum]
MQSKGQAVLFIGDLSYEDRYTKNDIGIRWDSWGRFVERSDAYQPWIWKVGNHEIDYMLELGEVLPFKKFIHNYATPFVASKSSDHVWYAIRRASAHIIVLSSYSPFLAYTPQWRWLREELTKVDREKTPWLIVLMHVPLYNSNEAHFMEGESTLVTFESWFLVMLITVHDKSAPVYLTVGDGGNQEGLASTCMEASYGHSTLEIMNRTRALYHWHRNDDSNKVTTDYVMFLNKYS